MRYLGVKKRKTSYMAIKVLVVDDSLFMRKIVTDIIAREKELELVGTANNGEVAVKLNKELEPDVILLDVEMPKMNGIEALTKIMEERPCSVIMFSTLTSEGAETTIKAIELGAADFVTKPRGSSFKLEQSVIDELLTKLKHSRMIPRSTKRESEKSRPIPRKRKSTVAPKSSNFDKIVAIGISTGGPRALNSVLKEIPEDIEAPILVVQHMPKLFTKAFAERLDGVCELSVKEAENGDILKTGVVYIAPGDFHLRVANNSGNLIIVIGDDEKVSGHRPSADAMFDSLCKINNKEIIAVIMTGMGKDGAEGMLKLKQKGAKTIAQDKNTSVVYGMPKSAVELGAVDIISPLDEIAAEIINLMGV